MLDRIFVSTRYITFCWGAFSLYSLILLWQRMVVNLHAAHKRTDSCAAHEALLVCFLLSCITRIITRVHAYKKAHVQYTTVDSCAAHFVSRVCFDSSHDKNWRTRVFAACKCQLRCELYCIYVCTYIYVHKYVRMYFNIDTCIHTYVCTTLLHRSYVFMYCAHLLIP